MKRLRILLSAYYFSPYRGGESTVGWKVANELAKHHNVTVLCGDLSPNGTTGKHLREFEKENLYREGLKVHYVLADKKTQRIHDFHSKPGMWFLYYTAYKRWQMQAYLEAKNLHEESSFDIIHHLNIIGYREPGYLWQLNVPFVWGPIAGASQIPLGYLMMLGRNGMVRWGVRNNINWLQMHLSGRSRKAAGKAAHIWVVSEEDRRMVFDIWGRDCELMIETGTEELPSFNLKQREEGESLRMVWSGLHNAGKALSLLLYALSDLPQDSSWNLVVLGDGAERDGWMQLSETLGISGNIQWLGMLTKHEALREVSKGHILVHSSLKEGTPHVVLEAMGSGLPVICHDACGMSSAVTENCGIKVPLKNPETSIEGFKAAIQSLLDNHELLKQLSEGALARAKELSWDKKVKRIAQTYVDVVDRQNASLN